MSARDSRVQLDLSEARHLLAVARRGRPECVEEIETVTRLSVLIALATPNARDGRR